MDPDHIPNVIQPPRPPNAWILYRSEMVKKLPKVPKGAAKRTQAETSRMIARMWREESTDTRDEYERLADIKKAEHRARFPNYSFRPVRKAEKKRPRVKKRGTNSGSKFIMTVASSSAHVQYLPLGAIASNFGPPSPSLSDASSTEASPIPTSVASHPVYVAPQMNSEIPGWNPGSYNHLDNPVEINDAEDYWTPQQHQEMMQYINPIYYGEDEQYPNDVASSSTSHL